MEGFNLDAEGSTGDCIPLATGEPAVVFDESDAAGGAELEVNQLRHCTQVGGNAPTSVQMFDLKSAQPHTRRCQNLIQSLQVKETA